MDQGISYDFEEILIYSVYIKGANSGQCILSTSTKSYNIEKIDTSNTVLLCDKVDENSIVIKGISGSYLEVGMEFLCYT